MNVQAHLVKTTGHVWTSSMDTAVYVALVLQGVTANQVCYIEACLQIKITMGAFYSITT